MKLVKGLLKGLAFVLLGILGGMLWQTIVIPYLAEQPRTRDLWFVRNYRERQVVLYPRQETVITENEAVTEAVKKVEGSVVSIRTVTEAGRVLNGSGMIYTSDGLIVTLSELVPLRGSFSFWTDGEEVAEVEVVKRDINRGLALVRVENGNLPTVPFAPLDKLEKGERVFMVGTRFQEGGRTKPVNEGVIKEADRVFLYTNIFEEPHMRGSVLFDIEGRALGINKIGLEGEVLTIPVTRIQEFVSS